MSSTSLELLARICGSAWFARFMFEEGYPIETTLCVIRNVFKGKK